MIKIKMSALMAKIDKNAAEIARETKINRNTIMSLAKGRVDGLKFPTLDKLCLTYGWKIEDILEFVPDKPIIKDGGEVYRQEGEGTLYFMWPGILACNNFDSKYFQRSYPVVDFFFQKDYFWGYFYKDQLFELADEMYREYQQPAKVKALYEAYLAASAKIINIFRETTAGQVAGLSDHELKDFAQEISGAHFSDWTFSVFLDAFDAGFDQAEIKKLTERYALSTEEVYTLITPVELTFNNEKKLDLMRLAQDLKRQSKRPTGSLLRENPLVAEHIRKFSYYKSNYARFNPLTREEVVAEIMSYQPASPAFRQELHHLENYSAEQEKAVAKVLKKYHWEENPLFFFQKLTYIREYRKMMNLMYFVLADHVMGALETRSGIAKKYLKYLRTEEIDSVLAGAIGRKQLAERYEEGIIATVRPDGYKVFIGAQAQSLRNEWEQKLSHKKNQTDIIYGQVASQGYVRGRAKIVLGEKDFAKFAEGEILVSGMTRPEFLPLMKKAAAIVTNEGGITCHAAIVSRELNKPCIIGTKIATDLIHDNDLIEVRANHGTVRIIKRAE